MCCRCVHFQSQKKKKKAVLMCLVVSQHVSIPHFPPFISFDARVFSLKKLCVIITPHHHSITPPHSAASMRYIGAIDQGTTSSRFVVFNKEMDLVCAHQLEHRQITPNPGWLQLDAEEIFNNCEKCIAEVCRKLRGKDSAAAIEAIGITNQRETTVAWSRSTGRPLYHAIVWSDMRTSELVKEYTSKYGGDFARAKTGLPCSTYFSAFKMCWLLRNVPQVRSAAENGDLMLGTIDSWLLWKLCGEHVTDCTNSSRTMLMDLQTLQWDETLCQQFGVPRSALPRIVSNSEQIGFCRTTDLKGTPITGCIGDQQGALVGQMCLRPGQGKNTYGTGCFLLVNVGQKAPVSTHGLLSTVGFKLGPHGACNYALEGSVAGAGSCIQWLRDKLRVLASTKESEEMASSVSDTGGVMFVPAFSGLLAPHWRPDARGVIVGLTLQSSRAHVVRAALLAITLQVADVIRAMEQDANLKLSALHVDGGMVANQLVMQMQADVSGVEILVPSMLECTALGAALCAGLTTGMWKASDLPSSSLRASSSKCRCYKPQMSEPKRKELKRQWNEAIQRSLGLAKL